MLGFGALGQFALGQADSQVSRYVTPVGFDLPVDRVRRAGMAAALFGTFTTLVLATSQASNTTGWRQQPLNPEVFSKPIPAPLQQFAAFQPQGTLFSSSPEGWRGAQFDYRFAKPFPIGEQPFTTAPAPQQFLPGFGWRGHQLDYRFAKPFPAVAQQFSAHIPEHVPSALDVEGFVGFELDYAFVVPFKATLQQFAAFQPQDAIYSIFPDGWEGVQLEYRFKAPFADAHQQFNAFEPQGFVQSTFPDGWRGFQYDYRFAVPFPAVAQQYSAHVAEHVPEEVDVEGYHPFEWDYAFKSRFPVASQQYVAQQIVPKPPTSGWQSFPPAVLAARVIVTRFASFQPRGNVPSPVRPDGWRSQQYDYRFAKPFPAAQQQYLSFQAEGFVPTGQLPGAGKYPKLPSYIPQPAEDAKPNKPFRPVWDKARQGAVEAPAPKPAGPVPRPPAEVFGQPGQAGDAKVNAAPTLNLPSFDQYAGLDPEIGGRLQDAQDLSDALAVLKRLGLLG